MAKSLPSRPDLDQLKKQAKELHRALQLGDPAALQRFRAHHPRGGASSAGARTTLADAQLILAREHGFAGWPALTRQVEQTLAASNDPLRDAHRAFADDDAPAFRRLLDQQPALRGRLNEPVGPFAAPAITQVRSRAMLDVLLEAGADINARSRWWAGGFGLLDLAAPDLAAYAIERGARVDGHAASRLGLIEDLRRMLDASPDLVHARGGDGQTPLHVAATVEIARLLLDHGAEIDALDVDHESTPAQYMARDRIAVARFLVQRGCRTDVLLAAALGDVELARRHLDADPTCVHLRVTPEHFPMRHPKAGGTIYQWTLGRDVSAHDVARERGHDAVFQLLLERSPVGTQLLAACSAGDDARVDALLRRHPHAAAGLAAQEQAQVAHVARNNATAAVALMLKAGFPVDATGQHGGTALHWAAFHGNAAMVCAILAHRPPLEARDADFRSTPLGWAIHGSLQGWHARTGDYAAVVRHLLAAGANLTETMVGGSEPVRATLLQHLARRSP